MDKIVKELPAICNSIPTAYNTITAYREVDDKCSELRGQLQQIKSREKDMIAQLKADEASDPCKEKKDYVVIFFERAKSFNDKATKTLEACMAGGLWERIFIVRKVDNHLKKGQILLNKADRLMKEGLTRYKVYTRGTMLPVETLVGKTAVKLRMEALSCIKSRASIIGIHGCLGAGKTNLLKFLHNDVCNDLEHFKAVFWAEAPQDQQPDIKSIQDSVAQAMKFKFEDEDEVVRSSLLAKKLKDMAPGHVVLFLDNVQQQFPMHEVGIPIGCNEAENFCCTLVFTASSENICNKMYCSNQFKMGLLPEDEARELFLQEAGRNTRRTRSYSRRIEKVADDVAKQCARMPLVITLIARSMTGKEDICEWRNRLNELMGIVEDIHGDEAKILEQLKFSFNSIRDHTIRGCFLESAGVLLEGHKWTKQKLIQHWVQKGRISRKRHRDASSTATDDQGHTIINELERVYLLEVVELDGNEYVSMNKWIRKMAENITP